MVIEVLDSYYYLMKMTSMSSLSSMSLFEVSALPLLIGQWIPVSPEHPVTAHVIKVVAGHI